MSPQPSAGDNTPSNGKVIREEGEPDRIRPRDVRAILRFLRPYLRNYGPQLLALAGALLAEAIINACFPLATQYLIDEGLAGTVKNLRVVVGVLIFIGAAVTAVTVLGIALDYLSARTSSALIRDLRQNLFTHLQTLSMQFFTRTRAGEVLSRFSGDVVALEGALTTMAARCVVPLLEVAYSVGLLFYFNVRLGLIASLVFPLTLFGPRFFAARAYALSYEKRRREADVLSAVQENVAAQGVVKAFGLEKPARVRFGALNLRWLAVSFRVHFLSAMVERSSTTGVYIIHLLSFGLGAYWVYTGAVTLGTLVAFEATFLNMGYAMTYVTEYVPVLAQAAGSIHHIDDLLAQEPQVADAPDARPLPRLEREIAFEGVSFRYANGAFELQRVDARFPRGSFTAIVGASGSGKSTTLNLLLRLYDPAAGAIRIDGFDLREATQESLRAQIGMVFQETCLFNSTILENISLGNAAATQVQVEAAARAAEIHDFVQSLPAGYHTVVGERGGLLSGGQRQRLGIARALVRDPAILILDEATSALDYATEAALNHTLLKVAQNRTVLMVTHRLSSAVSAARIVVLEQGRVVEQGTHEELLARGGAYQTLWRNQTDGRTADAIAG